MKITIDLDGITIDRLNLVAKKRGKRLEGVAIHAIAGYLRRVNRTEKLWK
nr:hypothetical protein [Candidatus Sigynarchaeota archaeon]